MDREAGREGGVCVGDLLESLHADRGAMLSGGLLRVRRDSAVLEVGGKLSGAPDLLEDGFQPLLEARHDLLGILNGNVTAADQSFGVELANRPLLLDQVVHSRLREARIVALIVTAPAIADEVDDNVLVELLPEGICQPSYPDA